MARLANSLVRLRDQVNAAYPNRNKASDGWIGDAAHAASPSDHNPNSQGVVNALDLTNDPAHGFDVHALAERLRVNRHPNLRYIISNSRIASAGTGWNWARYGGSNPHSKHAHFSVGYPTTTTGDGKSTGNYDDSRDWNIKGAPAPQQGGDMINADQVKDLYRVFLGREASQSEANSWVGDWARAFYQIKDSAEGQAYRARQAAERAVAEANRGELTEARAKLVEAQKALEEERAKATEDTKTLDQGAAAAQGFWAFIQSLLTRKK